MLRNGSYLATVMHTTVELASNEPLPRQRAQLAVPVVQQMLQEHMLLTTLIQHSHRMLQFSVAML
jgi:hypothetical protein